MNRLVRIVPLAGVAYLALEVAGNGSIGNFPDSNAPNVTAFWLLDLGSNTTNSVTINDGKGVSNAQILGTGTPAVPEPATWALMLFGFAGIGVTMRRRRQPALAQIA